MKMMTIIQAGPVRGTLPGGNEWLAILGWSVLPICIYVFTMKSRGQRPGFAWIALMVLFGWVALLLAMTVNGLADRQNREG